MSRRPTPRKSKKAAQDEAPAEARSTVLKAGAGVALCLLALYLATLSPTIHSGDAPELATAGATFGIPHPPGYALYCLVVNLWCRALPLGEVAWRINLLSALAASGAAALLFATLARLGAGWMAAAFAALSLGVGATFWSQALISEVYAFDLLLAAGAMFAAVRARQRMTLGSALVAAVCLGLWLCHRTVNVLYAPVVVILAWPAVAVHGRSLRGAATLAAAAAAPLLLLLYLPLASAADPMLDTGDPETWPRFVELVTAKVYRQYLFSGDLAQNAGVILGGLPRDLGAALALAPLGLVVWWRRQRAVAAALGLAAVTNLLFATSYGVPDVAVFVLPGILALSALAGLAFSFLARRLPPVPMGAVGLALVLALAGANMGRNNLRAQTLAADFARDALSFAGKKALVLSHVDTVSFSLWYVQYVEGRRPDVLVVSKGRAVDWHQEQARRLRPDLAVPFHAGADAASAWPAKLVERNGRRVPIYVTANLRGYFFPADAARLAAAHVEVPAGLMTRLAPRDAAPRPAEVVRRNAAFWKKAWEHARSAREQRLNNDMTSVLLHYASMRILFAAYCLRHGFAKQAAVAAAAVSALESEPLIAQVNEAYRRMNARYHMTHMPQVASSLTFLARARQAGRVTRQEALQKLATLLPTAPPARPAPPTMPTRPPTSAPPGVPGQTVEPPQIKRINMQGIALAKQGRLAEALPLFDQVLERMPGHRGALFNRAKVLALMGRRPEAIKAHEALLELSPNSLPALVGLGDLVLAADAPRALKLYKKALDAPGPPQLKAEVKQRIDQLRAKGVWAR